MNKNKTDNSDPGELEIKPTETQPEYGILELYRMMLRSRKIEEYIKKLWEEGLIPGEMHLGTGEEAIMAGVMSHIRKNDYVAVDHRGTSAFILKGEDPVKLILECIGHPDGLCGGNGGHMHMFDKELHIASSGIVGASAPAAVGFALALRNRYLRQKYGENGIAVSFFGEGAMNQGMVMEAMNLAAVWNLPVLFVCKDNNWAITTKSNTVTAGDLIKRAEGLGVPGLTVDGTDVIEIFNRCYGIIKKMRRDGGPFFLHAVCIHKDGHFLGDPLLRFHKDPIGEFKKVLGPLMKAIFKGKGAPLPKRLKETIKITRLILSAGKQKGKRTDPVNKSKKKIVGIAAQDRKLSRSRDIKTEKEKMVKFDPFTRIESEIDDEISQIDEIIRKKIKEVELF